MVAERETAALEEFVNLRRPAIATCALAVVEVLRAVRVAGLGGRGALLARRYFDAAILLDVDRELIEAAVGWTSAQVRSLDALHLASALRVGAREMLVYDRRLAEAAASAGLTVLSPGT